MLVGDRMTDDSGPVRELRVIRNGVFNRDLSMTSVVQTRSSGSASPKRYQIRDRGNRHRPGDPFNRYAPDTAGHFPDSSPLISAATLLVRWRHSTTGRRLRVLRARSRTRHPSSSRRRDRPQFSCRQRRIRGASSREPAKAGAGRSRAHLPPDFPGSAIATSVRQSRWPRR